jgi:hypothetical protein
MSASTLHQRRPFRSAGGWKERKQARWNASYCKESLAAIRAGWILAEAVTSWTAHRLTSSPSAECDRHDARVAFADALAAGRRSASRLDPNWGPGVNLSARRSSSVWKLMAARLRSPILTRDFQPATRDTAEMLKVTFDNGDVIFLMRRRSCPAPP